MSLLFSAVPLCTEFGNTCDENAECYEQDGSFGCICKDGYAGNGFLCEGVLQLFKFYIHLSQTYLVNLQLNMKVK